MGVNCKWIPLPALVRLIREEVLNEGVEEACQALVEKVLNDSV
jgi:hypothetical protein